MEVLHQVEVVQGTLGRFSIAQVELLPGAPVIIQGGLVGLLLALVLAFVVAILKGALEPRATSKRVEEVYEKRYQSLQQAYLASEEARTEALEVAKESLDASRTILAVLEEIRRESASHGQTYGPKGGGS